MRKKIVVATLVFSDFLLALLVWDMAVLLRQTVWGLGPV